MPLEPRSHVLIDLDGTLVDSVDGIHAACVAAALEVDRSVPSRDFVLRSIGRGADRLLHRILRLDQESALHPELHAQARARFDLEYQEVCLEGTTLREGVVDSLETLRRAGHRLWIATNKPRVPARRVIERLRLDALVDGLFCPEDAGVLKPDPRFIQAVLDRDGGDPNRAMLVGDSSVDARTAENAGIPFIAIRGGYDEGRDIAVHTPPPDAVIDSPRDLPKAIRNVMERFSDERSARS